jgi:hypothetical protein
VTHVEIIMPFLNLKLSKLEDYAGQHLFDEFDLPPTNASGEVMDFMRAALTRIQDHPLMQVRNINPDIPCGASDSAEVILCSPQALEDIFEMNENTLGFHNITNPDCDPFADEAASARLYRVMIAWDPEWVGRHIEEASMGSIEDSTMSWLVTLTHELQHVVLFAENGAMNNPADLESMEGETGRDLFDISTGYGIRPLNIRSVDVWAGSAEQAGIDMERYVEARGVMIAEDVFRDDLSPERFLVASNVAVNGKVPEI